MYDRISNVHSNLGLSNLLLTDDTCTLYTAL